MERNTPLPMEQVQKTETAEAIVAGFKKAGIDFVVIATPDMQYDALIPLVRDDPAFVYVPAHQEASGAAIAAGAWLGGKKPAYVLTTAGFYVMLWQWAAQSAVWGIPYVFLIPYVGDLGTPWWNLAMRDSQYLTPSMDVFKISYKIIEHVEDIEKFIVRAEKHAASGLRPVGLLLGGDTLWPS